MTLPLEVDVTGWVITQLAAVLPAPTRVGSETPAGLEGKLPFVRVVRAGGSDDGLMLDRATVVLHCFGVDQPAANVLAYTVGTALRALRGKTASGAVLTHLAKLGGPTFNPNGNPALREAVLTYQLTIRTAAR